MRTNLPIVMPGAGPMGVQIAASVAFVSWPASRAVPAARPRACLCRPSTTLPRPAPPVVDGRAWPHTYQDKVPDGEEPLLYRHGPACPGHDGGGTVRVARPFSRLRLS